MTGREKRLAGITVGVAALTAIYVYAAEPLFCAWRDLRTELAKARKEYASSARLLALRRRIDEAIERQLPQEDAQGSVEEESALLFKKIEALAFKANLRIREMRPASVRERSFGRESEITLAAEGPARSLGSFLFQIEIDPSLLCARRMEIGPGHKRNEVRVNLSLVRIIPARETRSGGP